MTVERIQQDVILITSGGRTGTSFFGQTMDRMVRDCWSVHEPDVWRGIRDPESWRAVRWFGFYHAVVGKVLRRTGMRCVAERFLSGDWTAEKAATAIVEQRRDFYREREAPLITESNAQWVGLLKLLPRAFARYRALAFVRDPRSWVRSWVNYGAHHDESDQVERIGLPRISPVMMDDEWADEWSRMDAFERICWDWRFVTSRIVEASRADPRIRVTRFEDVFESEDGPSRLEEALEFVTDFGDRSYEYRVPPGILEQKMNVSRSDRLGPWETWPERRRRFLLEMCGEFMAPLGYDVQRRPGSENEADV